MIVRAQDYKSTAGIEPINFRRYRCASGAPCGM